MAIVVSWYVSCVWKTSKNELYLWKEKDPKELKFKTALQQLYKNRSNLEPESRQKCTFSWVYLEQCLIYHCNYNLNNAYFIGLFMLTLVC